jgi:glucokinase
MKRWWVGVDIGGTKTAVALSSAPPAVASRVEFATEQERGPEPAIAAIKAAIRDQLAAQGAKPADIAGIGVSCGSPLDPIAGVIQSPPNLATWIDVPIVDILSSEFSRPVSLENDANAGAMAEHRFGAGRGTRHMVFLTMGTGLGAGIVIDGRLHQGVTDSAGEIGHVRLTRTGPVGYRKAGSVEGWASGGGMAQVAEREMRAARKAGRTSPLFDLPPGHSVTARDVALAAHGADKLALRITGICGRKLGETLAILVDILNPECIVIGGLAMRFGELVLKPARKRMRKEALGPSAAACKVVPAQLGEHIGDVAALCTAMDAAGRRVKSMIAKTNWSSVYFD